MATDNEQKFLGWDGTEQLVATVKNLLDEKMSTAELQTAIDEALAQAKASGEFNGANGKTPVRGTDYWTEADKAEIKSYVDEAILGGAW